MSVIGHSPLAGASGAAGGGDPVYVDEVFSTFILEGNGSTQTVVNGIDLAGEGGLVWSKGRDAVDQNALFDTERGTNKTLISNSQARESTYNNRVTAYNSNGFTVGGSGLTNENNKSYVSWTFRKAPKFFDVVTYSGTGSAQNISHSLGSVPGMIMIHCRDGDHDWEVYHRGIGATKSIHLNQTDAAATDSTVWNNTAPTSSVFTVGTSSNVNQNGHGYVAYVFAHDEQSFGTDSDEAIIKCGSYTGASAHSIPLEVNVGFEPQWVLIKDTNNSARGWVILDTMRGWAGSAESTAASQWLRPDVNNAESGGTFGHLRPTGFVVNNSSYVNGSSNTFIYMAIRMTHKPPTAGTDVFAANVQTSPTYAKTFTTGFPVDLAILYDRTTSRDKYWFDRLRGPDVFGLETTTNHAETFYTGCEFDRQTTWKELVGFGTTSASGVVLHAFRRAPGVFDIVTYQRVTTTNYADIPHNLGVQPELVIIKNRSNTSGWRAWSTSLSKVGIPNGDHAFYADHQNLYSSEFYNTDPTATTFRVGTSSTTNGQGGTVYHYVAYLFASLDGISKVGTYSGTGNNIDVDCGFTAGARFVLIKRTDTRISGSTGWYVWDSTRGIVSGNDPYLLLNETAVEVTNTDYIDPLNAGFTVTSSAPAALNTSGGTYLFLAIA